MNFFEIDNLRTVTNGRWLQRPTHDVVLKGAGIDSRDNLTGKAFVAIKGERFDGHDFLREAASGGASLLMIDRELPASEMPKNVAVLLVEDTRKALARMALMCRRTLRGTKVIAVAGSAGKTTTKRLIDTALSSSMQGTISPKSFNNDIGVPLTILSAKLSDKYLVVEVGTNHLGEITHLGGMIEPDIVVITMIGREHLEGLGSIENVAMENAALLNHLRPGGLAIVNADAPLLRKHLKLAQSVVKFGEAGDADIRLTKRGRGERGWWFEMNDRVRFNLSLPGKHNAINALAAVAVARRLGVHDDKISEGLAKAEGPPMRMNAQQVGSITVYNDAYNANPESMMAALDTFVEVAADAMRRIVILGDMLELGDTGPELHREMGRHLLKVDAIARIDHAVLVGELSAFAAAEIAHPWSKKRVTSLTTLEASTLKLIAKIIQPGDAVLIKGSRGMAMERVIQIIEGIESSASSRPPATVTVPKSRTSIGKPQAAGKS